MTTPPEFKTVAIQEAFMQAMADGTLTQDELKKIVKQTLRRDRTGIVLQPREVQDLLLLSRHSPTRDGVTAEWLRRYVLGLILYYVRPKSPPKTHPKTFVVATRDAGGAYRVRVQILDDGADQTIDPHAAETGFDYSVSDWKNSFNLATKRVQSVSVWPRIESPITIQTRYGMRAQRKNASFFGRGTTNLDILEGNTSLGFHEACHRKDQELFLKNQPLPQFQGRVRMPQTLFVQTVDRFKEDVREYFAELEQDTYRKTDEVGFKKSEHTRYADSVLTFFRKNHP